MHYIKAYSHDGIYFVEFQPGDYFFEDYPALSADLREIFSSTRCKNILIDLNQVTRLDSIFYNRVVEELLVLKRLDRSVKVIASSEYMKHYVSVTHLSRLFEIYDNKEEAIKSCQRVMIETVAMTLPSDLRYIHFLSDATELFVKFRLPRYSDDYYASFMQDLRILMYELFSNAVNHSQSENVTIKIEMTDKYLTIIVQTNNKGFSIQCIDKRNPDGSIVVMHPPYSMDFINREFCVYRDVRSEVICRVTGSFSAQFFHTKNLNRKALVTDIPEHYGLNLITKFSHETHYSRDESGIDSFTIKKRIG